MTTVNVLNNSTGQRIEKTVNGVTTRYILSGTQVAYEMQGNDALHYSRDGQGGLFALTWNEETYFYVHNLQGDVIGLLDRTGALVVRCTYDTWGKPLTVEGSLAETLGQKNPYRYRGYSYDGETGLYYLGSRYYNPEIGRFINADTSDVLTDTNNHWGKNLYTYCDNNPANRIDPTGEAWYHWAIGGAIVVGCVAVLVFTAGGATPAIMAIGTVASGAAAPIGGMAATIAAGSTIGSGMAFGGSVLIAVSNSRTVSDFNTEGNWGTVGATAFGAGLGGLDGLAIEKQPKIEKIGTLKPDNKSKSQGNLGVKYSFNKGSGRAIRSFELHSPHKAGPHQQWHWQKNTWNPFTNSITGKSQHWTLFGRKF